ncbi:hypothetical protein QOT17_006234 [Balamuthia mandrillaris]
MGAILLLLAFDSTRAIKTECECEREREREREKERVIGPSSLLSFFLPKKQSFTLVIMTFHLGGERRKKEERELPANRTEGVACSCSTSRGEGREGRRRGGR